MVIAVFSQNKNIGGSDKLSGNIYLIGLMGCGKTTVGTHLANLLGWQFVDTDQQIEKKSSKTINNIFEALGEAGFRRRETEILKTLAGRKNTVIATGGGIVLREDNCKLLHTSGITIYLRAPLELLTTRLKNSRTRPLLKNTDMRNKLAELFAERRFLYENNADLVVDVESKSVVCLAQEIYQILPSNENRKS